MFLPQKAFPHCPASSGLLPDPVGTAQSSEPGSFPPNAAHARELSSPQSLRSPGIHCAERSGHQVWPHGFQPNPDPQNTLGMGREAPPCVAALTSWGQEREGGGHAGIVWTQPPFSSSGDTTHVPSAPSTLSSGAEVAPGHPTPLAPGLIQMRLSPCWAHEQRSWDPWEALVKHSPSSCGEAPGGWTD